MQTNMDLEGIKSSQTTVTDKEANIHVGESSESHSLETTSPQHATICNSMEGETWEKYRQALGWKASAVVAMAWCGVVPEHTDWPQSKLEYLNENSWSFQRHYLDRASHFLPPSAYNPISNQHHNDTARFTMGGSSADDENEDMLTMINPTQPKCRAPPSILCVATCANGLHLYLHGRYRILSMPSPPTMSNLHTRIIASSDLGAILTCTTDSPSLSPTAFSHNVAASSLYLLPSMIEQKHNLQIIASSYCSIMMHISALQNGMSQTATSWSSSLRQLDMKFDQLAKLLKDYDALNPSTTSTTPKSYGNEQKDEHKQKISTFTSVRARILEYILGGHSGRGSATANAMDQFFTHPLMNDQLLIRLERNIESNVAGLESSIRKTIVAPARALFYCACELHGLVESMQNHHKHTSMEDHADDLSTISLMDIMTSRKLCDATEILHIAAEQCARQIVDLRLRLTAMMKWIRSTASHVKARGTAADSIQRQNARKRRVTDQTLREIAYFLSMPLRSDRESDSGSSVSKRGSTEYILGILLSDQFSKRNVFISNNKFEMTKIPTVKAALETSNRIALDLFDQPQAIVANRTQRINIKFELSRPESAKYPDWGIAAVHKRIGGSSSTSQNCFAPTISKEINRIDPSKRFPITCRKWILFAGVRKNGTMIQIVALPAEFNSFLPRSNTYYLTSFFSVPDGYHINDLHFYGDDGNSTLTSAIEGSNKEGRQGLGVLLFRSDDGSKLVDDEKSQEELWLFNYDDVSFAQVAAPFSGVEETIYIRNVDETKDNIKVLTHEVVDNDFNENDLHMVLSKSRIMGARPNKSVRQVNSKPWSSQLILSGSRGIGGVISNSNRSVNLFDLEEDEDSDEE